MKINEVTSTNPFPKSRVQQIVFHGTNSRFDKFERRTQGIYVARFKGYVEAYYGDAIPLYIDVRKIYDAGTDELDPVYDVDYEKVAIWLAKLKRKGYDAVEMHGDGDSLILIGDVPIVHADSKKEM